VSGDPSRGEGAGDLGRVVEALAGARLELLGTRRRRDRRRALPSRRLLGAVVGDLRAALFPDHLGCGDLEDRAAPGTIGQTLESALRVLEEQVRGALWFACEHTDGDCSLCDRQAVEVTRAFAARLPAVRALLGTDVRAAFEGDPAATSFDEALLCYPGVTAITLHRFAHELYRLGVPLVPRVITEIAHTETGVDIHPGAQIGASFFIDHGTGVVIGETAVIGERVRLYQGVTLGAKSFELDEQGHPKKGVARHPIVEDDVIIYAEATILGRVTIGRGSVIGGNVWLTRSVPPGSRITQAQARQDSFQDGSGI